MQNTTTQFKVGDLATFVLYTDSKAGRIIEVSKSGKKVIWQQDEQNLLNGANSGEPDALKLSPGGFCGHTSGTQRWEVKPDANGVKHTFTLRGTGKWKMVGQPTRSPGCDLIAGSYPHYDFNF